MLCKKIQKRNEKLKKMAREMDAARVEYILSEDTPFDITEAFRNLKASLSVSIPKKQTGEGTAILMTSAYPQDGKTTVSVNLAMMFAMSEAKVVIVDADIRKAKKACQVGQAKIKSIQIVLHGTCENCSV